MASASECPPTIDGGAVIHFEGDGAPAERLAERYASLGVHFADTARRRP